MVRAANPSTIGFSSQRLKSRVMVGVRSALRDRYQIYNISDDRVLIPQQ